MDGDRLLRSPRVLLSMDVYPVTKESGAITQHHLGQDASPEKASHGPRDSEDTDNEVSLARLQPTPFFKKAASRAGRLVPNLNSLQFHLEGNISCSSAMGQRHQANLGNEASLVNEVFCVVFQMIIEAKGKVSGG